MTRLNRDNQASPEACGSIGRHIGRQWIAVLVCGLICLTGTGCRLCCDTEDAAYAAYGGAWQRTLRNTGRVGSLSEPAGARVDSLSPRDPGLPDGPLSSPLGVGGSRDRGLDDGPESDDEAETTDPNSGKSEEEREREFQEKMRKFEQNQLEETNIIPGAPAPPDLSLRQF